MRRKVLVLGGTDFVGPAVVGAALAHGDDVTVFHRGQTGSAPDGVRVVHGDRTQPSDLDAVAAEQWDLVVDAWSRAPRVVLESARKLEPNAARYVYISTISVYQDVHEGPINETSPVVDASPDADATDYAADKRGAELAIESVFGSGSLRLRASRTHPWAAREHRPPPVVASSHRGRWHGARSRTRGQWSAVHRRARPRRLLHQHDAERCGERADRARIHHHGRVARPLQGGDRIRRDVHVGRRRVSTQSKGRAVDGAPDLGSGHRRVDRLLHDRLVARAAIGTHVPSGARHRVRHLVVVARQSRVVRRSSPAIARVSVLRRNARQRCSPPGRGQSPAAL